MKRIGALLLALLIAVTMAGCGTPNDPIDAAASPSPDPTSGLTDPLSAYMSNDIANDSKEPDGAGDAFDKPDNTDIDDPLNVATPSPTPTPAPTPSPTPVVEIPLTDYAKMMVTYTDEDKLLSIEYPSHWTVEANENSNTIRFTEPVPSGKTPMRLALTVKPYEQEKLTSEDQKKSFQDYINVIKEEYDSFKAGKTSKKPKFMNRPSVNVKYQAKQGDARIRGFVIMTANTNAKQIVALHFSAPQAKFLNAQKFFSRMMYSVTPIKPPSTT